MFTGIIEEIGQVLSVVPQTAGRRLTLESNELLDDCKIGDSIAIDGVCQTVEKVEGNTFTVFVSKVTEELTTLSTLKSGSRVNLERALTPTSRMGGHIVQGHVDCTGTAYITQRSEEALEFRVHITDEHMKYVAAKGSVAVNGVSLTVVSVSEGYFVLYLIPESIQKTTLAELYDGEFVNVEVDVISKYVEQMLKVESSKKSIIDVMMKSGFM